MTDPLKLMCVFAHPDDESLGMGGTLAKYAAEGVETYLVMATRGERGWPGSPQAYPGPDALGMIREAELRAAAKALSLHQPDFLGYIDGDLDQADPAEAVARIVGHLRSIRPQVVVTFGPEGGYGHPDHIAICQFTTAAAICAADPDYSSPGTSAAHRVSKLYYKVWTKEETAAYDSVFGDAVMHIDGVERRAPGWAPWAITTQIDAQAYWRTVRQAVAYHRTQLPNNSALEDLSEEDHKLFWGRQGYYRVYSTVNGGRRLEHDLFEGLR